jgi:hypothetical protein
MTTHSFGGISTKMICKSARHHDVICSVDVIFQECNISYHTTVYGSTDGGPIVTQVPIFLRCEEQVRLVTLKYSFFCVCFLK